MKYDIPLLKGVLRCKCGCLMGVARKKLKTRIQSHYCCRKRSHEGVDACDMRYIKCDILDGMVLDIFRGIEADPDKIMEYVMAERPRDGGDEIGRLEANAARIQTKIDRLTESLVDAEGSTATKYIIAQIEREDLDLSAVKREIEMARAAARKNQRIEKSAGECAADIARLIHGLEGFTDVERNSIVKKIVRECRWDGTELFLRF